MNPYTHASAHDISITEDTEEVQYSDPTEVRTLSKRWTAEFSGVLHTGETVTLVRQYGPRVTMSRSGNTAREAHDNLIDAMVEQGWRVT